MTLENQVCTIEQGKRLLKLGVTAQSLFYWYDYPNCSWTSDTEPQIHQKEDRGAAWSTSKGQMSELYKNVYPAFTLAELGAMLPTYEDGVGIYKTIKDVGRLPNDKSDYNVDGWSVSETFPVGDTILIDNLNNCVWATEAQARAAMLIHLLENNIITASECNERLNNA